MNGSPGKHCEMAEGEIIRETVLNLYAVRWEAILAYLVIQLMCWCGFLAWWNGNDDLGEVALRTLMTSLVALAGVVVIIIRLVPGERLILGKDCLQRVTKKGRVLTQIPYKNIARIEFVSEPGKKKFIGINLKDPNDSDTFDLGDEAAKSKSGWPQAFYRFLLVFTGDDSAKNKSGWHYRIPNGWLMPLQQINERLRKRLSS